ncbi:pitrilysin family protein [Notoacmeibacter sp. MSK16QG-6]|uniref:M16 family metallopeptidase n=1 Tax=Notoacmeibacter sp. MSK16QG-6 TaxID=2957982 RepID=UPI00209EE278|nr:pitrilysin family protein [Notoacmeibacter sp. MSK16QG-6]MCP1198212.1 insulinase family protein [Notoacmeibacter sp. MSK16QG-6]
MRVQTTTLANGLIVATETRSHVESVALGLWNNSGSRHERPDEHGIAHLLEHMAFKGTRRRSAEDIAFEIENVGGEINASTSVETTSFFARVLKEDVGLATDILCDILRDSVFDEDELQREKHVIVQEIGAAMDTPDDIVFDRFAETAFQGQPVGRSVLGTRETIEEFSSEQLRSYLDREYGADRMIAVAVGAVEHEDFLREIESRLGDLGFHSGDDTSPEAVYTGGDFRETRSLLDAQILIGFEGKPFLARDFYASQLLATVLGGGMSSRLFQEVRERRGLCYSVSAFHWSFSDTGLFGIHAATGEEDIADLVPVILEEMMELPNSVRKDEVDRARAQLRASLFMSGESSMSRASQIARQLLIHGRVLPRQEIMDRLSDISVDRVGDLAYRTFSGSAPTVAAIGPLNPLLSYDDFHSSLHMPTEIRRAAAS